MGMLGRSLHEAGGTGLPEKGMQGFGITETTCWPEGTEIEIIKAE